MKRLAALGPYFRRYPWRIVGGMLSNLAAVGVGLATPVIVGRAVDAFRADASASTTLKYAGALLGITAVQGVFSFLQRMILVTLSRNIEFDIRNDYFAHLERLPLSFYQRNYTGDLMARGTNDLQAVRMLCGPAIMYSTSTLFTATGALLFMASIHGRLTLLALATMPLVAMVTQIFGQRIHHLFQTVQEQFSNLSTKVQESMSGARVIRAYAQESAETEAFARFNRTYVESNRRLIRWTAAFHPLLQALVGLGFVGVLWYGGLLVGRAEITVGQFVTFNFFLAKLIWPMIAIGWVINLVQRGTASLGRILQILRSDPEIRDEEPFESLSSVDGGIEVRGLTLSYRDAASPVLAGLTFKIRPGETVAVVGRTGSGKSTLLSVIPRLVDPPRGTVFVDGVDIRALPLAQLRGSIAVVPQETFLFSASVRENISLGRPDASAAEIEQAAKIGGLEADLAGFPKGLDTLVGERGITLSGGQKQRVALARAVLRDPRILLLDDCLSAVDTHTEEKILENLKRYFPGRTVLLVSHRISTVRHADQILVLEAGEVVEHGNHQMLIDRDGIYADLHRRQQLEEELLAV